MKDFKVCKQCNESKHIDNFRIRNDLAKGKVSRRHVCIECVKWKHIKRTFGITKDEYYQMFESQDGRCAICKITLEEYLNLGDRYKYFSVDHCHTTGKVRGLLCTRCNAGLGGFNDNKTSLKNAISYLKSNMDCDIV